MAEVEFK